MLVSISVTREKLTEPRSLSPVSYTHLTLAALAKDCGLNVLPYYSSGYVHVEI